MLDSTTISGTVLSKLPIGKFLAMVRYDTGKYQGIAIEWYNLSSSSTEYYDVLTGDRIYKLTTKIGNIGN